MFQKYSDAEIVLSKNWVPPVTIAPVNMSMTSETDSPARKKTNSVSFSLDSSSEVEGGTIPLSTSSSESKEDAEKADNRKNKVSRRARYSSILDLLTFLVYRCSKDCRIPCPGWKLSAGTKKMINLVNLIRQLMFNILRFSPRCFLGA